MFSTAKYHFFKIALLLLFSLAYCVPSWAAGPEERIRYTTNCILSLFADPSLSSLDKIAERESLIRRAVNDRFDWEEISRRSLGKHWKERTEEEKREFVSLFSELLERTYLKNVKNISGEKIYYEKEIIDKDYGSVEVKMITDRQVPIHVKYHLLKKNDDWLVYDVSIGGVSLVNNYRNQFNNILRKSPYKKLAEKLKDKVKEEIKHDEKM